MASFLPEIIQVTFYYMEIQGNNMIGTAFLIITNFHLILGEQSAKMLDRPHCK